MQKIKQEKNNFIVIFSIINLFIFLELLFLSNSGPDWEVPSGIVGFMLLFTVLLFISFFIQSIFFLRRKKEPLIWISYITGVIPNIICFIQWISKKTIIDSLRIPKMFNDYLWYIYFTVIFLIVLNFIILGRKILKKRSVKSTK